MVRWSFEIEGQPVSWNAAYRIGTEEVLRRGRIVRVRKIVKTDEARAWTDLALHRCREGRPSGWYAPPETLIVVEYRLHVGRHLDADNAFKLTNDGIAAALGVNDKWFLPRAMSIEWGLRPAQRRVEITIDDGVSP